MKIYITWIKIGLEYPIAYSNLNQSIYHKDVNNRACIDIEIGFEKTERQQFMKRVIDDQLLRSEIKQDFIYYHVLALLESAKEAIVTGHPKYAKNFLVAAKSNKKYMLKNRLLCLASLVPAQLLLLYFQVVNFLHKQMASIYGRSI